MQTYKYRKHCVRTADRIKYIAINVKDYQKYRQPRNLYIFRASAEKFLKSYKLDCN